MKMRVVSSKEEIDSLGPKEQIIHLAFRPSNTDIFSLIMKCPQVKALHIPNSYIRTVSKSARMYLGMQGIALLEGDVWGHRKDINEYSQVSYDLLNRIAESKMKGLSEEEIQDQMLRETRLSPDFIRFLIRKS